MSSINQIPMTGIPSASSGQGALFSSESRKVPSLVASSAERTVLAPPSKGEVVMVAGPASETGIKHGAKAAGVDPDTLSEAIEAIREKLEPGKRALDFSINETLNDVVVKVVDPSSQQVIREIPPEEIIVMRERLREFDELRWSDVLPAGSLLSEVS